VHRTALIDVTVAWVGAYVTTAIVTARMSSVRSDAPASEAPSLRTLGSFGLRGLLGATSPVETLRLDQAVVGLALSPSALGIYVVAMAFTNLPRIISQSIGMVAFPSLARRTAGPDAKRMTLQFVLLGTAGAVASVAVLELAIGWALPFAFGHAYAGGVGPARILLVGALFWSIRRILADVLRGEGRPFAGTLAELTSWVVLLPGVGILGSMYGLDGVAVAVLLAAAASMLVCLFELVRSRRPAR
jgi:O-antigen/teichoic acid export membrane protein